MHLIECGFFIAEGKATLKGEILGFYHILRSIFI